MRTIDITAAILGELSGLGADHFLETMLAGVSALGSNAPESELLRELSPAEAIKANEILRSPQSIRGAMAMLSKAGIPAKLMTPSQEYAMHAQLHNLQN